MKFIKNFKNDDFFKRNNINMANADLISENGFGKTYYVNKKLLRITYSSSEYILAKLQMERKFKRLVEIYDIEKDERGNEYLIYFENLITVEKDDLHQLITMFSTLENILLQKNITIDNIDQEPIDLILMDETSLDQKDKIKYIRFAGMLSKVVADYKKLISKWDKEIHLNAITIGFKNKNTLKAFNLDFKI